MPRTHTRAGVRFIGHTHVTMMMLAARLGQCAGHANTRVTPTAGAAVQRAHNCARAAMSSARPSVLVRSFRVSAARWVPPDGDGDDGQEAEPTNTQALIDAMGTVAKAVGRDSEGKVTTVMGDGVGGLGSNMTWQELDEKVNTYPSDRKFQAIGEGGDAFVAEIVGLVEGALGRDVKPEDVTSRWGSEREGGCAVCRLTHARSKNLSLFKISKNDSKKPKPSNDSKRCHRRCRLRSRRVKGATLPAGRPVRGNTSRQTSRRGWRTGTRS